MSETNDCFYSEWVDGKTMSRFTRTQGEQKMGNVPEEKSEQYQEGERALGNRNGECRGIREFKSHEVRLSKYTPPPFLYTTAFRSMCCSSRGPEHGS